MLSQVFPLRCAVAARTRDDDYCEWESFNASCSSGHVIVMVEARYGRMRVGRCVGQSYGHIGCGADVLETLNAACGGRQQCVYPVISLYAHRSCPKDFTSYLYAAYHCRRGLHHAHTQAQAHTGSTARRERERQRDIWC